MFTVGWHGVGDYEEGLQHAWFADKFKMKNFCEKVLQEYPDGKIWFSLDKNNEPTKLECPECRAAVDKFMKTFMDGIKYAKP